MTMSAAARGAVWVILTLTVVSGAGAVGGGRRLSSLLLRAAGGVADGVASHVDVDVAASDAHVRAKRNAEEEERPIAR